MDLPTPGRGEGCGVWMQACQSLLMDRRIGGGDGRGGGPSKLPHLTKQKRLTVDTAENDNVWSALLLRGNDIAKNVDAALR